MNDLKDLVVLYVEDDEVIAKVTIEIFELLFAEVIYCKDGEEGFTKYNSFLNDGKSFDMIISDINMPKLNGIEMAKKIREKDLQIPIVFLTAFTDTNYLLEAIEIGVCEYILKPTKNLKQLYSKLHKAYLPIKQRKEIELQNIKLKQLNEKIKQVAKEEMDKMITHHDIFGSESIDFDKLLDSIEV